MILNLTEKGKTVTQKLFPAVEQVLNKALQGFSEEEFNVFKSLTLRMLQNIAPDQLHLAKEQQAFILAKHPSSRTS